MLTLMDRVRMANALFFSTWVGKFHYFEKIGCFTPNSTEKAFWTFDLVETEPTAGLSVEPPELALTTYRHEPVFAPF